MFVHLNGKWLKKENASVSINNRSFRFGDGCFETMRLISGQIPLADFHFQRLFTTLEKLQFSWPSFFTPTYLMAQIEELASKNGHQKNARIRMTLFRGNGGLYDPENLNVNWLIQTWPLEELSPKLHQNGLEIGIYPGGFKAADAFANLKTNNFLLYSQAALYAKQQHWNDALVLNHRGAIADATIANFFLIKGNHIITPPLSDGPLAGVMRRYLLEQLPRHQFTVAEETIFPAMLAGADAAFISNAVFGIRWIRSIGENLYQPLQTHAIYGKIIYPLFHS
jgi:branched-subunit amino acid aminotransferase/4-amino-4-deoxychorismate lyase